MKSHEINPGEGSATAIELKTNKSTEKHTQIRNDSMKPSDELEDEINAKCKLILFTKYFQIISKRGYHLKAMCRSCNVILIEYLSKCTNLLGHLQVC